MTTLLILLIWFYGGCFIAQRQFGWTVSISRIYYEIQSKYPGWQWVFTAWFTGLMILVTINLVPLLDGEWYQFLGFFAAIGLGMVGVFPEYLDKKQGVKHYIGAGVAAASIITIACLEGNFWLIAATLPLALRFSQKTRESDLTYWLEHAAFALGFLFMGIHLFVS